MKHSILLILIFIAICPVYSQINQTPKIAVDTAVVKNTAPEKVRKDQRPMKDRLAFGLGTSFWINVNTTHFEIDPMLAYRFPKTLTTGMGYRYIYRHDRIWGENLNAYGPNFFARANLIKKVYFWTEYEILTSEYLYEIAGQPISTQKSTSDSWFAGLGFVRHLGKKGRGGISLQVLYNFLYTRDDYSPYYSPVTYRIGYFF